MPVFLMEIKERSLMQKTGMNVVEPGFELTG
jgi:hypothetical protein